MGPFIFIFRVLCVVVSIRFGTLESTVVVSIVFIFLFIFIFIPVFVFVSVRPRYAVQVSRESVLQLRVSSRRATYCQLARGSQVQLTDQSSENILAPSRLAAPPSPP